MTKPNIKVVTYEYELNIILITVYPYENSNIKYNFWLNEKSDEIAESAEPQPYPLLYSKIAAIIKLWWSSGYRDSMSIQEFFDKTEIS